MSIHSLLTSLGLVIVFLFGAETAQAHPATDLRHRDGVEVMEDQREGLKNILVILDKMKRLAEQAALPSSTQAIRVALDTRFQALIWKIQLISQTPTHGYIVLNATVWVSIQAFPGSSQDAIVRGLDVAPHALDLNDQNLYEWGAEWGAMNAIAWAKTYVLAGLDRNCIDLSALGQDTSCDSIQRICRGGVNSTGADGWLSGYGSLITAKIGYSEQLFLNAERCPTGELGWFVMGQHAANVPFGNGSLCIDRSSGRIYRLSPATLISSLGGAHLALTNVPASLIPPGSTWYFQFLFQDSAASANNSTNALRVSFVY
jgi:hypothetical protein